MRAGRSKPVSLLLLSLLVMSALAIAFSSKVSTASPLLVTVQSPSQGSTFNRGQNLLLIASVSSGGNPVSGATVTANNPTGANIVLTETATPGTYSALYTVAATDPLGAWVVDFLVIKNAQTASASVPVQVSSLLLVTVLSPAQNSKFNIGEGVTIKATATYLSGSPLGPSASVRFSNPAGGSGLMVVDPSDSSDRIWIGTYTILGLDVPADGVTWHLMVTASLSGNTGTSVSNVILYKTLTVGVATFGSADYSVPKDSFAKGETVYVKATPDLQDGTPITIGSASFTISGTSVAALAVSMVFAPSLNAWTGSYAILSSDQAGSQTVAVAAADFRGNGGSGSHQIGIGTPTGLAVSITSPSQNVGFNRGEVVPISATVTSGGTPVTGATVTATSPTGSVIVLTGGAGGTYSAQYTILSTDPIGLWSITVTATQGGQTASSLMTTVISARLAVSIISPPEGIALNIGQTATVKAHVTFQDGSVVPSDASVVFNAPVLGNVLMSLDPSDSSHRTWKGVHTITSSDVPVNSANWNLVVSAEIGGNTGSSGETVFVFNTLNIFASTWSSSSFTNPKDSFVRGDTVFVEARVTLVDGTAVSSGTANFVIAGTSIASSPVALVFSASLNAWVGSYTLLQSDSTGVQTLSVSAMDPNGNRGTGTHVIGIESPVPTPAAQPLEAKITFDPQAQDLAVRAVCNAGCTGPTSVSMTNIPQGHGDGDDKGDYENGHRALRTYTVTDSAGHSLILKVLVKMDGDGLKAKLLSIQYGSSSPISMPGNEITFNSNDDEGDNPGNLDQRISVSDHADVSANYNGRTNVTHIQINSEGEGDDEDDGGQNLTLNGLWLLDLATSGGSLSVGYFLSG